MYNGIFLESLEKQTHQNIISSLEFSVKLAIDEMFINNNPNDFTIMEIVTYIILKLNLLH